MIDLKTLNAFLSEKLPLNELEGEPSNNGIQVQGSNEISKAIFSVDTSVSLINKAIERDANFIFVHHGLSWGDSLKYLTGYNYDLVKPLIKNDISLYAAHLPLDAQGNFGHNAIIADMLKLYNKSMFAEMLGFEVGVKGQLKNSLKAEEIAELLNSELSQIISSYSAYTEESLLEEHQVVLPKKEGKIEKVGIVTGNAGMKGIFSALSEGLDCLITGEFGHTMYHLARENNISVIALGHYKTEVPGVIAVMDMLKNEFDLKTEFINIPTGI